MRVLHITYWYPNPTNTKEAIWVKRHIEAIAPFVEQKVIHLQIKPDTKFSFCSGAIHMGKQQIISLPLKNWFVIELFSALLLLIELMKVRATTRFDIINFHIAYPNLTYWHLLKKIIRVPIVITEHWSAYHYNFGVIKPLPRIQHIFKQNIPVISVSNALIQDIKLFSKCNFPHSVIHNVVDSEIFYPDPSITRQSFFFMISKWNKPKNPFIAMEAFLQFSKINTDYKFIIGGYGKHWDEMNEWVNKHNISAKIKLVGMLESKEIANYLQNCCAFVHPSNYETFSVVCAEAISCGTPVIASNVGGIPEVIGEKGILIKEETVENWATALHNIVLSSNKVYIKHLGFSKEIIGKKYVQVIYKIINETTK